MPAPDAIPTEGLELSRSQMAKLLDVDRAEWRAELPLIRQHFDTLGERLPPELAEQLEQLERRLTA